LIFTLFNLTNSLQWDMVLLVARLPRLKKMAVAVSVETMALEVVLLLAMAALVLPTTALLRLMLVAVMIGRHLVVVSLGKSYQSIPDCVSSSQISAAS
jgi:hypothetical protein